MAENKEIRQCKRVGIVWPVPEKPKIDIPEWVRYIDPGMIEEEKRKRDRDANYDRPRKEDYIRNRNF